MDLELDDNEIFKTIFDFPEEPSSFRLNVILDISQPIIYELEYLDKSYLVYVLRDTLRKNNGMWIKAQELLFSEVKSECVSKLIKGEQSIYDSFIKSTNIWRVGRVGGDVFPRKVLEDFAQIRDRFPIRDLKIKDLPNKAKIIEQKKD